MRSRVQAIVLPSETLSEFVDEVRQIFADLGRGYSLDTLAGECAPPIDVFETDSSVEVSVDLPGVDRGSLRIVVRGTAVLVAGEKAPRRGRGDSSFHLVERGFGRFARIVRFSAPCDAGRGRAILDKGELRISLPKVAERRGRAISIEVKKP